MRKELRSVVDSSAVFSDDQKYRYRLIRVWDRSKPVVAFIGLNPSTADAAQDDPTIRRCVAYAKAWGFGGMHMYNIFGLRSTDPKALYKAKDPEGLQTAEFLFDSQNMADKIVLCWGNHGKFKNQGRNAERILEEFAADKLYAFGMTKSGQYKHPLYLKKDAPLYHRDILLVKRDMEKTKS